MRDEKKIYCAAKNCGKVINNKILCGDPSFYCTNCKSHFHSDCLDIRYEKTDNFFRTMANVGYCPICGKKLGWGDNLNNKKEKKTYIHFIIDKQFKEEIETIAKNKGLPTASYIKMILKEKIQEHKNKKG